MITSPNVNRDAEKEKSALQSNKKCTPTKLVSEPYSAGTNTALKEPRQLRQILQIGLGELCGVPWKKLTGETAIRQKGQMKLHHQEL
jgi:hypothetical protein